MDAERSMSEALAPMLKRLEIRNFRSCYSTTVTFADSVSAIVGKNGVGKTNILKCIEWLASSSISPVPVSVGEAGNTLQNLDEISTRMLLDIDGHSYDYRLGISFPNAKGPKRVASLRDSLAVLEVGDRWSAIFRRDGGAIVASGRPEPIRTAQLTPSIAALNSLLSESDSVREHLSRISAFFAGVRYYPLQEREGFRDFVPEQQYVQWVRRYHTEGYLTNSVALRLIYMWSEDKDLCQELRILLGPDGLGVLDRFDIIELDSPVESVQARAGEALKSKIYLPLFEPSSHMGGAGQPFRFSELSVGTRRIIRIVTSLLFDRRPLMLMEQPEDSVHAGLLRKLVDLLRSYSDRSQIVFTTHSTAVLDVLRPENILLATAPQGRTAVRELLPDEIEGAQCFLKSEGSLSEFLEPFDE